MTNADPFTLGSGKGRQNYGYFLPEIADSAEQPCLWNLAPHSRYREGALGRQRPGLDTGPNPVSEPSELGEHS